MNNLAIIGELKTHHWILNRLQTAIKDRDFSLIVVFPTLSLLKTIQAELLDSASVLGIGGFRLLLFQGFTAELRQRFGLSQRLPGQLEQDLLLSRVLKSLHQAGKIPYLSRVPFNSNYRRALLDGISEWRRSSLLPELFHEWAADQGSKAQELALVYGEYQRSLVAAGYTDDAETVEELQKLQIAGFELGQAPVEVVLYGFTDLTPLQNDLIAALKPWYQFEAIVDPTPISQFQNFTQKFFQYHRPQVQEQLQSTQHALSQLQTSLWMGQTAPIVTEKGDDSIQLIQTAGNRRATAIAREISKLLKQGMELSWDDCLIIAPQPQEFMQEAAAVFASYGWRFTGKTVAWRETILAQEFLYLLNLVATDWQWPELRGWLLHIYHGDQVKMGEVLVDLIGEKHGALSGRERWLNLGADEKFWSELTAAKVDPQPLQMNLNWLESLPERATYRWYLELALGWFAWRSEGIRLTFKIDDPLSHKWIDQLKLAEQLTEAIQNLLRLEINLSEIESETSLGEFQQFFEEVILEGEQPEALTLNEGIRVIQPRESRGLKAKVIFILGLEQGVFPRNYVNDWKLDSNDRFDLKTLGIDLESGENYQIQEKLSFYWSIQGAEERLYLVYQDQDESGEPANPSPFLKEVEHAIPQITESKQIYLLEPMLCQSFATCYTEEERRQLWVKESLRSAEKFGEVEVYQQLLQQADYGKLASRIVYWLQERRAPLGCNYHDNPEILALLDKKFGPEATIGITALEDYLLCPYRFLLKYVLGLRKSMEPTILPDAMEVGNLLHQVLAEFTQHYQGQTLSPGQESEYLEFLLNSLEGKFADRQSNAGNQLLEKILEHNKQNLQSTLQRWLAAELTWAEATNFSYRFHSAEIAFGYSENPLPAFILKESGLKIKLAGRVDRVDVDAAGNFLIYDYKLGKGPTAKDLQELVRIQIPAYLLALQQLLFTQGEPVGGAYLGLKNPNRSSGLWSQDCLNFTGNLRNQLSAEAWEDWLGAVKQKIVAAVQGIRSGAFEFTENACIEYCEYRDCCRREEREVNQIGL